MNLRRDLTGKRFHKLIVLEWSGWRQYSNGRESEWKCQCDCGKQCVAPQRNLVTGRTKSCGCIIGQHKRTHGATVGGKASPEFMCWIAMRGRCENPSNSNYFRYGARGIKVCERWFSFEAFLSDMGPRPSPAHSIDRINNDGNYEPGNCRWADMRMQSNNRRSGRRVTFNGETRTLAEWERHVGLKAGMLHRRLAAGWALDEALSPKLQNGAIRAAKRLTHDGFTLTVAEWAEKLGISVWAMKQRVEDGLPPEKVFFPGPLPSMKFGPADCPGNSRHYAKKESV